MFAYSSRDAADLARLPIEQVRDLARAGLIRNHKDGSGRYRFGFQDVVLLRSARTLQQAHISARRIRQTLRAIKGQLPPDRPLASVRLLCEGNRVMVKHGDVIWDPLSGQATLGFAPAQPGAAVADVERSAVYHGPGEINSTPRHWYDLGVAYEVAGAGRDAETAYHRALALDPDFADAHLKLSQLYEREGRQNAALRHLEDYRRLTNR